MGRVEETKIAEGLDNAHQNTVLAHSAKNPRFLGFFAEVRLAHNDSNQKKGSKMIVLHIEHTVFNFDNWKASFDSYEEFRQKSGVRRYQISRPIDNPNCAMIDLEFDSLSEAEALLAAVQQVWQRVAGTLIQDPHWRFSEVIVTRELQL
jgi:hypothetical protein